MDRQIVYAGAIPLETDILNTNRNTLTAIAQLCQDIFGTSTVFTGLGCVPAIPAALTVTINPGRVYSLQNRDTLAYSSLAADTVNQIVKQGIMLTAQSLACAAPATVGFSVNYLISASFVEQDITPVVLPYYNSANPAQAFSGPGNTGASQNTTRQDTVQLTLTPGIAAATGSQTTPATPVGTIALWVVTVANGQTTITSSSIAQTAGAPILPSSVLASIQSGNLSYGLATGTANAHVVALTPALTARVDGMVVRYKAPAANTGALTLNDGIGAVSVVGGAHSALQGGETILNGDVWVQWNSAIGGGSYVMLDSTGGAAQIGNATQSQHAVAMGQLYGTLKGIKVFTSTGTFTPSVTGVYYFSGCGGGGGGGGGGSNNSASTAGTCGGGGGAGLPTIRQAVTLTAGVTYTVTIGAGGTAVSGAGQGVTPAASGGNGGATTLSGSGFTTITLGGGSGGQGGAQGASGNIGGSSGGTGFPNGGTAPDGGAQTSAYSALGGDGGPGPFGGEGHGGRAGAGSGVVASAGNGYGVGGGGGGSAYSIGGGGGASTAGMPGLGIIEW